MQTKRCSERGLMATSGVRGKGRQVFIWYSIFTILSFERVRKIESKQANKGYMLGQHNEHAAPFFLLLALRKTDFLEALRDGKE